MNKKSSVSFHLTNHADEETAFTAMLLPESQSSFAVRPTSGVLKRYGSEGTKFQIDFKPTEYGKKYTARLIIETDEMQWIYELAGIEFAFLP